MTPSFRGPIRNARMSLRRVFGTAAVLALVIVGAFEAQAQDSDIGRLLDRIDRLERDIRTLNLQIARGATPPVPTGVTGVTAPNTEIAAPAITRLEERFSELESDIRAATAMGCKGANEVKYATRCGMGPCQGRQCGLTVSRIIAHTSGRSMEDVGALRIRPPVKPITMGQLAAMAPEPEAP